MPIFYRRLPRIDYIRARHIEEALWLLDEHGDQARILAGGTDLIPMLKNRQVPKPAYVIDLKGAEGLGDIIYSEAKGLSIGALATISQIAESPVIKEYAPILAEAALLMASPQVRNRGTFVGNICSAVPSADSAPSLLVLNAVVRMRSKNGERAVPLEKFITGPRTTAIEPHELVTAIEIPTPPAGLKGTYLKLSPRHSMDLAVVGVAVAATMKDGICEDIRIAVGAVAPTPIRSPMAEDLLQGQKVAAELIGEAARHAVTQCDPIDDHRASREYRCDMVYVMAKRALSQVLTAEM
jgi:CO/xanthine dehydrogenase FAD-binding subunit